jgi:fucose permease
VPRTTRSPLPAQCLVYVAFAMPVAMFGAAWPEVRGDFGRPASALGVLAGAYGVARLSTSASALVVLSRIGPRAATAGLCLVLAAADLAAAFNRDFSVLLAALVVAGLATGALDSLGIRYQTAVRDVASAGLMFGSYGIGAALGPAVVATTSWTAGFSLAAALALVAAAAAGIPGLTWPADLAVTEARAGRDATAKVGPLVLSLSLFALYCGIEVVASSWGSTWLDEHRGAPARTAGLAISGFWAGMTFGRLFLGRLPVRPSRILRGGGVVTLGVLAAMAVLPTGAASVAFVALGFGVAVMFPTLTSTTAERVGRAAAGRVGGWQLLTAALAEAALAALVGALVAAVGPVAPMVTMLPLAVLGLPLVWRATLLRAADDQRAAAIRVDTVSTTTTPTTPHGPNRSP